MPVVILDASRFGMRAVAKVPLVICEVGRDGTASTGIAAPPEPVPLILAPERFGMRATLMDPVVILPASTFSTNMELPSSVATPNAAWKKVLLILPLIAESMADSRAATESAAPFGLTPNSVSMALMASLTFV